MSLPLDELRSEALTRLTAADSAVLVVDMTHDFVDPDAPLAAEGAMSIAPEIRRLLDSARECRVHVVHINERHRRSGVDYGLQSELEPPHCVEGTLGAEIITPLEPHDDEPLVIKRRYDGFFETDLRSILQGWGVKNLLLTGVATEVCIASTAYQAKSLDYRNFFVRECLAGVTLDTHEASLRCFEPYIGYVVGVDDVRARLGVPVAALVGDASEPLSL
jgi:nicotinamidase-related amidase